MKSTEGKHFFQLFYSAYFSDVSRVSDLQLWKKQNLYLATEQEQNGQEEWQLLQKLQTPSNTLYQLVSLSRTKSIHRSVSSYSSKCFK